jgi:ABC-2 type transport system ATP-binding protein
MEPLVTVTGLRKLYGPTLALDDVSITLPRDRIIGLLGPNGSGKTTLIKILAGLLLPTAGSATIAGLPLGEASRAKVAYLPERNSLPLSMTRTETLDYFSAFFPDFDRALTERMLDRLQVPDRPLRTLSKGNREKLQLTLVMGRRADLYLLDEPIGGVDPAARDYILEIIKEMRAEGATVLVSTHLIRDVEEILDEFVFIANSRFVRYGSVKAVREESGKSLDEVFREVFRC